MMNQAAYNKIVPKILVTLVFLSALSMPNASTFAQNCTSTLGSDGQESVYCLLAPLPSQTQGETANKVTFSYYFSLFFKLAIGLAAALAVLMIVWGGIQYMTSDVISNKANAKSNIQNALLGLLLAVASVVILRTINPALVTLSLGLTPIPVTPNTGGNITPQTPYEIKYNSLSSSLGPLFTARDDLRKAILVDQQTITSLEQKIAAGDNVTANKILLDAAKVKLAADLQNLVFTNLKIEIAQSLADAIGTLAVNDSEENRTQGTADLLALENRMKSLDPASNQITEAQKTTLVSLAGAAKADYAAFLSANPAS